MSIDVIFDTETSDKTDFKRPYTDIVQPDVLQFGVLVLENRYPVFEQGFLVSYVSTGRNIAIADGAYQVHGISLDMCNQWGRPVEKAAELMCQIFKKADRIVAHNLSFDAMIVKIMLHRLKMMTDPFRDKELICTMKTATPVCKLPGNKWPKLSEAYAHLVDSNGFLDAHNASADTWACARILWALEDRGVELRGM